jgi:predicted nuclease of predicted toxin-antitoxin system
MIVADENVERYWIEWLRGLGFEVFSIQENHPGISDRQVIEIVATLQGILLTEDKDFGELVFAYGYKEVAIVFLRYDQPKYDTVQGQLLKAISTWYQTTIPVFVTVTAHKIRITKL